RVIAQYLSRDRVLQRLRDHVPRKRLAKRGAIRRLVSIQRIVDRDELSVGPARVAEIARALFESWHSQRACIRGRLAGSFEIVEKERAIAAIVDLRQHDGSSYRPAEHVALEIRNRPACPVREPTIGVQRGIAMELVTDAMQLVRAALGN